MATDLSETASVHDDISEAMTQLSIKEHKRKPKLATVVTSSAHMASQPRQDLLGTNFNKCIKGTSFN